MPGVSKKIFLVVIMGLVPLAYTDCSLSNSGAPVGYNSSSSSSSSSGGQTHLPPVPAGASLIWTFDTANMAGNTVQDTSGNSLNGTANNTTPVAGRLNQALSYNGSTSYVQLNGFSSNVDLQQQRTITAWINTSTTNSKMGIVTNLSAAGTESGYILFVSSSGFFGVHIGGQSNGTAAEYEEVASTGIINNGQWHFVAATFDVIGGSVNLYVDGSYVAGTSLSLISTGDYYFQVGQQPGNYDCNPFNGAIDEVRVYDRILTSTEVSDLAAQ